MTVNEIFSKLCAHMATGVKMHNEMANIYSFLNLIGYQKLHIHQFIEESENYRALQDYYLNQYHKLIQMEKTEYTSIIPTNWYKYSREDVDGNTKRKAIKEYMEKWINWEKQTKLLLQDSYKQLCDLGEICASCKIKEFLLDVDQELQEAQNIYINLNSLDYDLQYILEEQEKWSD